MRKYLYSSAMVALLSIAAVPSFASDSEDQSPYATRHREDGTMKIYEVPQPSIVALLSSTHSETSSKGEGQPEVSSQPLTPSKREDIVNRITQSATECLTTDGAPPHKDPALRGTTGINCLPPDSRGMAIEVLNKVLWETGHAIPEDPEGFKLLSRPSSFIAQQKADETANGRVIKNPGELVDFANSFLPKWDNVSKAHNNSVGLAWNQHQMELNKALSDLQDDINNNLTSQYPLNEEATKKFEEQAKAHVQKFNDDICAASLGDLKKSIPTELAAEHQTLLSRFSDVTSFTEKNIASFEADVAQLVEESKKVPPAEEPKQEIAEEPTQKAAEEATQKVVEEAKQEKAEESTQKVAEEATQKVAEEATQKVAEEPKQVSVLPEKRQDNTSPVPTSKGEDEQVAQKPGSTEEAPLPQKRTWSQAWSFVKSWPWPWATAAVWAAKPLAQAVEPYIQQAFSYTFGPQAAAVYPAVKYVANEFHRTALIWAAFYDVTRNMNTMATGQTGGYMPMFWATMATSGLNFIGNVGFAGLEQIAPALIKQCVGSPVVNLGSYLGTFSLGNCDTLRTTFGTTLAKASAGFTTGMDIAFMGSLVGDAVNWFWHAATYKPEQPKPTLKP